MSYREMYEVVNILDEKARLKKFINHYSKLRIKGLHYVDFNNKNGIVHISTPEHVIHDEATLFLLKMKHESGRINTVSSNAHNLKKFLDFLLIWEIDLLKVDLLILMTSFVTYLRRLRPHPRDFSRVVRTLFFNSFEIKRKPVFKNGTYG